MTLYSRRKRTVNKGKKNKTVNRRRGKSMRGGEENASLVVKTEIDKQIPDKKEIPIKDLKELLMKNVIRNVVEPKTNDYYYYNINNGEKFMEMGKLIRKDGYKYQLNNIRNNSEDTASTLFEVDPDKFDKFKNPHKWGGAKKNKTKKGRRN